MNKRRRISLLISGICAIGTGIMAASSSAGPEKITFPGGWEKWERYGIVDRHDTKQYRELYAKPEIVKAVRAGKPIPDGTVLVMAIYSAELDEKGEPVKDGNGRFKKGKPVGVTVMEKRQGWGVEYPAEMRNGNWEYASFLADGKPNEKANAGIKACFACHKPHEGQDFVISLASLSGGMPGGAVERRSGPGIVSIGDFRFGPEKTVVKSGSTITWTNTDPSPHQVTVQGQSTLRTPVVLKGQSTQIAFNDVGIYEYICGLHPTMKGTVEVTK
jgi:plastocyanin